MELRSVVLLVGILAGFAVLRGLDPERYLVVLLVALAAVNLFLTAINCLQAWQADPRFLSATRLAAIQLATGVLLTALFLAFNPDPLAPATLTAASYVGGAALVVLAKGVRSII